MIESKKNNFDIFIIGGGVNGAGIARDASGRGLDVCLADMGDLGGATSSSSTKLFHGGLRYLEYFEFNLVKESLKEREILLTSMPHISWPMKFVLPYHDKIRFESSTPASKLLSKIMPWNKGKRPAWLIRLGLLLYDNLGQRKILPPSKTINLKSDPSGEPLKHKFLKGFEYSDCWVEDSRLVILNARDAEASGAKIMPNHKVIEARKINEGWNVTVENQRTRKITKFKCKLLINAGGPWVETILLNTTKSKSSWSARLVKGSHIVTKKLFNHEKSYFLQGQDGRIVFAIPYETDYTLIGTTDVAHEDISEKPQCSLEETQYLLNFVNEYFQKPVTKKDIVWSFSGIRPLYDDGSKSESAVSRDYFLDFDKNNKKSPVLHIYGGKITTYRKLAEEALDKISVIFPNMTKKWTSESYLPGGGFQINAFEKIIQNIKNSHKFLDESLIRRLVRLYGTEATEMLKNKSKESDLGHNFGHSLYEFEIDWGIKNEWVSCSDDFLWRRTKLGLRLDNNTVTLVEAYIKKKTNAIPDL
ncbi:MAG: glycerol-3-phosphate dehydrogenase [Paracoccaceae bacterium]|nr:glycerol-3-phosphate dehydrogenase [Paracoccaceae bacterium]